MVGLLSLAVRRSFLLVGNLHLTLPLLASGWNSPAIRLLKRRPELLVDVATKPFITRRWNARQRVAALIDHSETVAKIGGLLDFAEHDYVDLLQIGQFEGAYHLSINQSRWLQTEGLMTFGLCEDRERFFTLCFCLASRNGPLIAYVGGIQGRPGSDALEQHKRFTKRACGMRPRDFLVEAFRLFCQAIGVKEILAVSDQDHANIPLVRERVENLQLSSYDQLWVERGGTRTEEGFFALSTVPLRRPHDQIPVRKLSLYRRRYEVLEQIGNKLSVRISDPSAASHPRLADMRLASAL